MAKKETEDFTAYTATVNKLCEDFKINKMTADEFKCLIFFLGLKNPKEADIRSRLHNKMDSGVTPPMTLNALGEEAARLVTLKHDTKLGSSSDNHRVNSVHNGRGKFKGRNYNNSAGRNKEGQQHLKSKSEKKAVSPKYPCWRCGVMHFSKDCNFLEIKCSKCGVVGHKPGYCNVGKSSKGASPKIQVVKFQGHTADCTTAVGNVASAVAVVKASDDLGTSNGNNNAHDQLKKPVVLLENSVANDTRRYVRVKINGASVTFQLDTAADVSIMTVQQWEDIGFPPLKSIANVPQDAQNRKLPIRGILESSIELQGETRTGVCYVSGTDTNLFGGPWIALFGLWSKAPNTY